MNTKTVNQTHDLTISVFIFGMLLLLVSGCRNPVEPDNRTWQLDLDFGLDGAVKGDIDPTGYNNYLNQMAVDSNDRIIVTGSGNFGGGGYIMYVGRYNSDGTIDTSFATNGFFIESVVSIGRAVRIDSSGRIVVAGYRTNGSNNDAAVWRFTPNGILDTSFDGDGYATSDISGGDEDVFGMDIDSSGRIVLSGHSINGTDYDMALWRFLTTGSLDTSFGESGFTLHNNAAGGTSTYDTGRYLAIDPSGRIVVVGSSRNSENSDLVVWRFSNEGILDTAFNGNGWIVYNSGNHDEGYSVTTQSSGKIIVTGCSVVAGHGKDLLVLRFNSGGGLDTSFGESGIVNYDYAGKDEFGYSLLVSPSNQIFVAGIVTDDSSNIDMGFWGFDNNGSPLDGFGSDGLITVDYEGESDEAFTLTMDSEGRVLIGGTFQTSTDRDIFIRRYIYN